MSLQSYAATQSIVEDPRQTEYRLFAVVTRALMDAEEKQENQKDVGGEFISAIDWNRRLWSTLQFDLASDDNGFPDDLRAKLTSLAIWVDKHSGLVMRGEADIKPLISVNRTIMEGLA